MTAVAAPAEQPLARALAREAGRPRELPGLGRWTPDSVRLIVVPDEPALAGLTGGRAPAWGAGIAVPGARTIALRADAGDAVTTLRHELAHLALHQSVPARVPLWFDEGYAVWAAGEWDRLDALALNLAVVRGQVPDLRGLDGALRASEASAGPAYALAGSAALELARRNPSGSLEPLLARLRAGDDFDTAVRVTTGLTLPQFDDAWQRAVRQRYSLGTWLVAGGGWGLIALLVLALGRRRRRADAARRAALDEGWVVEGDEPGSDLDPQEQRE